MIKNGEIKENYSYIPAISPDGRKIVNISRKNNTVEVWDLETGTCLDSITSKTAHVACFSKDGTQVIYDEKKSIHIWEYTTKKLPLVLSRHLDTISSISLSPKGELIASVSNDGTIKLWSLESLDCIHTFKLEIRDNFSKKFNSVAFSPRSKYIIGVNENGTIRIWNYNSKVLINSLVSYKSAGKVFVIPDEDMLLVSMDHLIEIWNFKTGKKIRTLGLFNVKCLISIPEVGNLLVGAKRGDPSIWIFNLDKNQLLGKLLYNFKSSSSDYQVDTIFHVPNSFNLIATYSYSVVIFWNFEECIDNPIQKIPFPIKDKQYFTQSLSYSDGKELVISNMNIDNLDQIEGLGELTELNYLTIDGNNIHKSIIIALGGLDREGNAIYPERFIEYIRNPYEIQLNDFDDQRSDIWLSLKGDIIYNEINRALDLIDKGHNIEMKNMPKYFRKEERQEEPFYPIEIHRFEDFIGCTEEELNEFEETNNIKLPILYRQFLQEFGKTKGFFDVLEYNFDIVSMGKEHLYIGKSEAGNYYIKLNETDPDPIVYISSFDNPEGIELTKLSEFFFSDGDGW